MYQTGDLIIYGGEGVCRVEAVGPATVPGANGEKTYYTLSPLYHSGVIYAPTDVSVPMRPILTQEEALSLIHSIPRMNTEPWPAGDSKQAALEYKALLQTYEHKTLLRLIRMIYAKNKEAIMLGKGYGTVDERFLKRARELLHGELAASLGIAPDGVESFIMGESQGD